jgi:hypothetical protein
MTGKLPYVWAANIFVIIFNMSINLYTMLALSSFDPHPTLDMVCAVVTLYALFGIGQEISSEVGTYKLC